MSDRLFTILWVAALAGLAVFPELGWISALQILAFALWGWVMEIRQERDAAWLGQVFLEKRLTKYRDHFGPLPEDPDFEKQKKPEHVVRARIDLPEGLKDLPPGTELEITLPPKK